MAFACLDCRKSFKRPVDIAEGVPEELPCPDCGDPAVNLGHHFMPPKKSDTRQWEKVRFLVEHGFRFQKIRIGPGHHDTVPYPDTLAEAKRFVVKYEDHAFDSEKDT
jgi:hypothetical protein